MAMNRDKSPENFDNSSDGEVSFPTDRTDRENR